MDLIQENGQPRYGRFESVPSTIHVQHYIYKTPYGKVLKGWRKQLKYKKFKFCGIQHKHYSIGLAIADIGWVGHGFFYIYDHETQQVIEQDASKIRLYWPLVNDSNIILCELTLAAMVQLAKQIAPHSKIGRCNASGHFQS